MIARGQGEENRTGCGEIAEGEFHYERRLAPQILSVSVAPNAGADAVPRNWGALTNARKGERRGGVGQE